SAQALPNLLHDDGAKGLGEPLGDGHCGHAASPAGRTSRLYAIESARAENPAATAHTSSTASQPTLPSPRLMDPTIGLKRFKSGLPASDPRTTATRGGTPAPNMNSPSANSRTNTGVCDGWCRTERASTIGAERYSAA